MFNTDENTKKVQNKISELLTQKFITKRETERIVGHLNFVCKYMQCARFHIHDLVKFLCSLNRLGRDEKVILPQKIKEILGYWLQGKNYIAVNIQSHNSELTVYSDASKNAWGGVVTRNFQTQSFEGNGVQW